MMTNLRITTGPVLLFSFTPDVLLFLAAPVDMMAAASVVHAH